jgi:hypothetical protein
VRVVVTIDTEADGQWRHGTELTTANVAWWAPFQDLCERHGAQPTYLVTTEIAEDDAAVAFLAPRAERGALEVGAHLHPWTSPPFRDEPGLRRNDEDHTYPCQLEPELLQAKLAGLTALIEERFGARPLSFRAGRFGIDAACAALLAAQGYVVDSSLTPFVSWRDNPGRPGWGGGPDFSGHDAYPFRVAGTGPAATPEAGAPGRGLVELPVTILPTYAPTRRSALMRRRWEARPWRLLRERLGLWDRPQPLWLRPRPELDAGDLEAVVAEAERLHLPFAVLMFHSSELMPGGSPYRPTAASIDVLLAELDAFFAALRRRGLGFAGLAAAGRELDRFAGLPVKPL